MGARQARAKQRRRQVTGDEALRSYEKLLFLKATEGKPELELLSCAGKLLSTRSTAVNLLKTTHAYSVQRHSAGKYRRTIDDPDRIEHNCTRGRANVKS